MPKSVALALLVFYSVAFTATIISAQTATAEPTLTESETSGSEKISVLIVDGQNNHTAWPKSTAMMKTYLQQTGKFEVDIYRSKFTWKGGKLLKQFPLDDGAI